MHSIVCGSHQTLGERAHEGKEETPEPPVAREARRDEVAWVDDVAGDAEDRQSPLQTVGQQHVTQLGAVVT